MFTNRNRKYINLVHTKPLTAVKSSGLPAGEYDPDQIKVTGDLALLANCNVLKRPAIPGLRKDITKFSTPRILAGHMRFLEFISF